MLVMERSRGGGPVELSGDGLPPDLSHAYSDVTYRGSVRSSESRPPPVRCY